MTLTLLMLGALALIVLKLPIAIALGVFSLSYLMLQGIPLALAPQRTFGTLNNFLLLAVPMFMLAGRLMNLVGATDRIFDLARAMIGHLRGGMAQVNVVTSIMFSAMSGSAAADAVGVGSIMVKTMRDSGYPGRFAAAVTLASATLAPIMPPSIILIVYAVTAGVSVGKLFLAGIVPGLMIGLSLMVSVWIISVRRGYRSEGQFSGARLLRALKRASLPLLTPVIVLGGIFGGFVTPTEAAVLAVLYILFLGLIYRSFTFKDLYREMVKVGTVVGALLLVVAMSGITGWVYSQERLPLQLVELVTAVTTDPIMVMLLILALVLFLGIFMDAIPIIIILVPAIQPLIMATGLDPIHLGILFAITCVVGLITPPVGVCLFGVAAVSNLSVEAVFRATIPFFLLIVALIVVMVFLPDLILFLPRLSGL